MRYPFVLLDVGETLLTPRESFGTVYARVLAGLGFVRPADTFEAALRETWTELERSVPTGRDRYAHFPGGEDGYWLRFVRGALRRVCDGDVAQKLADRALGPLQDAFGEISAWRVYPDVMPALDSLRDSGVRLGVVSNWDSRLPDLLDRLGLARYFDALAVSHLEGVEKPDPALFGVVLRRLGAEPRACLHVGDLPDVDLSGARAAGIRSVLVDRRGRFPAMEGSIPDLGPLTSLALGTDSGETRGRA